VVYVPSFLGKVRVKIAMVTQSYYPQLGGVTEHVHHLSRELRQLGHRVIVITAGPGDGDGHDVLRIGRNAVFPMNGALVNVTLGVALRKRLRRIMTEGRFDVVHIHCPLEPTLPLAALMAVGDLSCPVVGTFHMSADVSPAYEVFGGLLQKYARRLNARIAVSEAAHTFALKYFPGEYVSVPNGVDFARFSSPRSRVPELEDGKINILYVGRFDPRKNIPWLISAFKRVGRLRQDCRLVLVGKGMTEPVCRLVSLSLSDKDIVFKGRVEPCDLPGYFASSHIFCSVPRGSESFGIVLLEAMAAGMPVIGTSINGYREIVDDGVDGILVRPGDTAGLVRAMLELVTSQDTRSQMGLSGQRKARQFDWSGIADTIENIYGDLCGRLTIRGNHESDWLRAVRLS
jgi:phosphatidylinositol alpha-mannosyltransferase